MAASQTRVRVAPNLYQRGDGRFVAGLTVAGRWTMKTLTARTKREAKIELVRLQANSPRREPRAEEDHPPTVIPVAQVVEEFLRRFEAQVHSGERSPRTLDHYRWTLRSYLLPAWGTWEISRVGPDDVVVLSQRLREEGRGASVMRAVEGDGEPPLQLLRQARLHRLEPGLEARTGRAGESLERRPKGAGTRGSAVPA